MNADAARSKLYLDEDVYHGVAVGLRRRGFDVSTTVEAGRMGTSDEDQLRFAVAEGRCFFTFNRGDFARLHGDLLAAGEHHHGIVLASQLAIGPTVRLLARLLATRTAEELRDVLIWLQP